MADIDTQYLDSDSDKIKPARSALLAMALKINEVMSSAGSSVVGFIQSGTGAVTRSAQDKLREIISRADFGSDANFNAAKVGKLSIDGSGNFDAPVTPEGEAAQLQLKEAVHTVAAGARDALVYRNSTSMTVSRRHATMGGFRYRGQYSKGRAPTFPMPASTQATCSPSGLGAETAFRTENWYAAFACANDGDATAVIKTMPFLRVGSVAGNVITLNKAGEGVHTVTAPTYAWSATNNLAGVECLVISEAGGWSGRVTTITANASGTVAVAAPGSLAFGDFLLPAPPGFEHFVYLASWYMDTAEVRNIYDSGTLAKGKMIYIASPSVAAGSFAAPGQVMNCAGYISPLATAVVLDSSCVLSTASTGGYAEYFDPDGANHIVHSEFVEKTNGGSLSVAFANVQIPFLYHQKFNYYNAGTLAATRTSGQLNITGWIEP